MAEACLRRAPRVTQSLAVQLAPPAARFILRGGDAVMAAAGAAFGPVPSAVACRAVSAGARSALWLGPDEQLLLAPETQAVALAVGLAGALAHLPHSLVEVSHRQVGILLGGPDAARLLNGACPLDLSRREFPPGMCTRTVFGKAEVTLWRIATESFRLEIGRSFAGYVSELLAEIGREPRA